MEHNVIGSGGSGKIYKIFIEGTGEYVAVKKIWNKKKLDKNLEKEFLAEVEILGTIRHANIVKLLCCISREDSKLLVYEYLEKRSLDQWLHGKKKRGTVEDNSLSWAQRLNIAVGAAQGLCYMHHDCIPAIIHRDVKSSNILLDYVSTPRLRILDWLNCWLSKTKNLIPCQLLLDLSVTLLQSWLLEEKETTETSIQTWQIGHGDITNQANQSKRLLMRTIMEASNVEEMTTVFKLGLMCTNTLPGNRPTMKEILYMLRQQGHADTKKIATEAHEAPLLVSLSGRRTSKRIEDEELGFA
ncbi:Protein kinase family protein with leucine-rich repeat domain [Raphanus sativus]|nr:Protein kinase family protein with leucine-rich repeat domain [Raphanus sativus]